MTTRRRPTRYWAAVALLLASLAVPLVGSALGYGMHALVVGVLLLGAAIFSLPTGRHDPE